jgi:ABC-2 type transport system ATP-binding protein
MGRAVVVSTPYMDEATRCSRIGFMYGGRILVEGTPRELTTTLEGRVLELAARPKETAKAVALTDKGVEDALAFGDRLHLRVSETSGPLARLPDALAAAGVHVDRLRAVAPSLEDVFISLLASRGMPVAVAEGDRDG